MRSVVGSLLMLLATAASAQVVYDSAGDGESPNRLKYPLTVGAGSNRALAVFVHLGSNCGVPDPTIGSVTYGGQALIRIFSHPHTGCGGSLSELWALPPGTQPATGTADVEIRLVGNVQTRRTFHSGAISATGVDQATTFSTTGSNDGIGTTAGLTLGASGATDLVIDSVCGNATGGLASTAQTQRWLQNNSGYYSCDNSGGATAVGGTTSLSWTQAAAGSWVLLGAAFKAAAAQTAAIDSVNSASGGYALAYPMTVGSGSNRALAIFTHIGTACGRVQPSISSVTYAGTPLTQVLARALPGCLESNSALWALPPGTQPTSGANEVIVTLGGTMNALGTLHSGAISATGVDQTATFSSTAATDGTGSTASVLLAQSLPAELVIGSVCGGSSITGIGPGQTERWRRNLTNQLTCDNSAGATADGGQTVLLWTVNNDYWMLLAGSFRASALTASDAGADAGADAGPGPITLNVGCGCGGTSGNLAVWALFVAAIAALARRRPRPLTRP